MRSKMVSYEISQGEIEDLGNLFKKNNFEPRIRKGVFTLCIAQKFDSIDNIEKKLNEIIDYINRHGNYNFTAIVGKLNINGDLYEFPVVFKKK